jgi:copper homeostasis protein
MRHAAKCGSPVFAMIRPRAGGFLYTGAELSIMLDDIMQARNAGLTGVVFGALTPEGHMDLAALKQLVLAAGPMQITLHRAFDLVANWRLAIDQAVDLGLHRILSSGGKPSAPAGAARLTEMFRYASGRIVILPGAGISAQTFALLKHLPLKEIHASCAAPVAADADSAAFGFSLPNEKRINIERVRALKALLVH